MSEKYNWTGFYQALCQKGLDLLIGADKHVIDSLLRLDAQDTDAFWSESLEEALSEGASMGDLREGVIMALEVWKENIISNYNDFGAGAGAEIENIEIDLESEIIDELVEAAKP